MTPTFQRLVRFKNHDGKVFYGELSKHMSSAQDNLVGLKVVIFNEQLPWSEAFALTVQNQTIVEVSKMKQRTACSEDLHIIGTLPAIEKHPYLPVRWYESQNTRPGGWCTSLIRLRFNVIA